MEFSITSGGSLVLQECGWMLIDIYFIIIIIAIFPHEIHRILIQNMQKGIESNSIFPFLGRKS